jgi:hypothetical protein
MHDKNDDGDVDDDDYRDEEEASFLQKTLSSSHLRPPLLTLMNKCSS